jgi:predicted MPP superfamily phosphohydrolase
MKPIVTIAIILLILLIFFGISFYVFFRLWHIIPVGKTWLVGVAIVLVSCFFLGFFGGYFLPSNIAAITYNIGMTFFFVALYLLLIFLVLDLLRLVLPMQHILFGNWRTFIVLTIALSAVFTYGYFNYRNKVRVKLAVSIHKEISPLKIVAISDLHLGYGVGKVELEKWVTLINRENPDIVLIAGDITDNYMKPVLEQNFASILKKIESNYGVYACLGNHEYIGPPNKIFHSFDFLNVANIKVLRDTAILINNEFYLIGRDDMSNRKRKSLDELVQSLDKTKPLILLDHQPFHLNETEENGIDLQISGHTHRGQILPISWITDKMFEVSHGYSRKGNSHIYVSSGIGIWGGKFRIGTRSEYVVIELKQIEN